MIRWRIQNLVDTIQVISIFPKDSIAARKAAHCVSNLIQSYAARNCVDFLEPRSTETAFVASHNSRMKKTLVSMWSSSGLSVEQLVQLVDLTKLHGTWTTFDTGVLHPALLKMGLYIHADGQPGLKSLLSLLIKDMGLKFTKKQLLSVLYQTTTSMEDVKFVTNTFPELVEEFDEVFQREQMLAMLRVCEEPTIHMNMFHQYHMDYGHFLDMEAYHIMSIYCHKWLRLYFLLEILTVMVFRHKIYLPLQMFQMLCDVMVRCYCNDRRNNIEPSVTMEMCYNILTLMNYGVEEENQVEVLGYMLPVFSLVDGMRGYHKICELEQRLTNSISSKQQKPLTPASSSWVWAHSRSAYGAMLLEDYSLVFQILEELLRHSDHNVDERFFRMLIWCMQKKPALFDKHFEMVLEGMAHYLTAREVKSCQPLLSNMLWNLHKKRVRNDPCATKLTYSFFHIVSNSFLDLVAHSSVEKCIVELGTVASSNAVKVDLAAKDGRLSLTTSKKPKDYFNEKQRIKMCSSRR